MNIGHRILDFFFPRHCLYCRKLISVTVPGFICPNCLAQIVFTGDNCCQNCGRAMGVEHKTICQNCAELKPYFNNGISLFAFHSVGREFIHTLKYRDGTYLIKDLARLLEHENNKLQSLKNATFVPVPLHFMRKWKRGYNQSDLIANALKTACNGTISNLLRRKINTRSQTCLTQSERKQNVEGAFTLNVKSIDSNKTYVLVDDVFTTGATLNECASVLHRFGAKDIRVFTLAHG